jgi:hypothetical protein
MQLLYFPASCSREQQLLNNIYFCILSISVEIKPWTIKEGRILEQDLVKGTCQTSSKMKSRDEKQSVGP